MLENKSLYKTIKKSWPWLFLALALFLTHSSHLVDSDEGIILNAAWNIINGKKLYLDSFEFYAPGSAYLLAWWWKLSGPSYLSAAFLSYLISLSSMVGLYFISKKLEIKRWIFLAPALFLISSSFWPLINHNNFNIAAIIWASYCLILGIENKKYFLFLAGLFSSLAILFTQHKGIIVAGFFIVYLGYLKLKNKLKIIDLIYFAVPLVLPLLALFIFWSPLILYNNLILFPLINYPATNFLPLNFWLLCLAICGSIIFTVWPTTNKQQKNIFLFLSCLSLILLITSLSRADIEHVLQSLVVFLPIIALIFESAIKKPKEKLLIFTILTIAIISRFIWPPFDNLGARNIIKVIKDNCPQDLKIYAGPFMPGIYFESRSLNLTPFSFLITKQQTEEQFNTAYNIFKNNPPNCLVLSYSAVEKFSYDKNNSLDNFFKDNYKKVDYLGKIDILIKK
ncbi:MAG: hypothetical protein NTY12_04890 [Candidatus Falkowbacteria bacterium]|nr:hypothetical protein [Candidatus Falkowbacteria bacterium]